MILITHKLSSLLPTIRSRCIKFRLQNPNIDNFNKIIKKNFPEIQEQNINLLFDLSYGSPGLANQIYIENMNNLIVEPLFDHLLHF